MQISEELQSLTEGIWQWQSNPDPWSKSEEPQWESYSSEYNLFLEESYFDGQKEVELEDWIVSLEHMLQINKQDKAQKRPIRRIDWMEDEESNSRSARYCNMESPKPTNSVFGDLEDFLNFFSKRSPEIRDFAKLFRDIEKSKNLYELNLKICPQIENCIIKEFHKLNPEEPSKSGMTSQEKKNVKERQNKEKLFSSFQKHFQSFEEFFAQILRVYTLDTFLYRNLNKYLRDENWGEINDLLPYAFCLCRAFFQRKINSRETDRMTLYRGTIMSEEAVEHFHTATIRDFSWYAVTSTTRNQKVAEKFIKKKKDQEKKCRVIFIIEMPFCNRSLNYLDVSKYSAYPKEEEVLLPPGSLFEILKISKDANEITIIHIQLKELERFMASDQIARGALLTPGSVQSEIMNDRETKIVCLEGEELCAVLKTAYGNTLLEEIEFYLCTFDNNSLGEITRILQSMKGLKVIKFVLCLSKVEGQISKDIDFPIFAVQIYEIQSFSQAFGICKHWASLKSLSITFKNMTNQGLDSLCSEALQHLSQLTTLNLDFSNCFELTDEEVENLSSEGLKYFIPLEYLSLNFSSCSRISIKGINNLFEGLKCLSHLKSLSLDFSFCNQLTEKILNKICSESLRHLTDLRVNVKAYHSILKDFVFALRRFFGFISDDGQIAHENMQRSVSGQTFQKIITDLILRADSGSESYQSFKDALANYNFNSTLKNYSSSMGSERTSFLKGSNPKIGVELTPQYLTFQKLLNKLTREIRSLNCDRSRHEACFTPLNLYFYPSWMRDKTIDYIILKELKHYIQKTSRDFDCCESTVIEIFLKPWFEEISFKNLERSSSRSFFCLAFSSQISSKLSKRKNITPVRHLGTRLFSSKNSERVRFPKKAQKFLVFPKRHRGYPFS